MASLDPSVFVILGSTGWRLRELLADLPNSALVKPVDEGWSVKHALSHLVDTEDVIAGRIRRIVTEDNPFIESIDPTARLKQGGYLKRGIDDLFAEFEMNRNFGLTWLKTLSDEKLQRTGTHDEAGVISAANHAHQWAYHDLMHLKQIESMLGKLLEPGMGNTLRFYFDV
jgi:hypothetical protein